MSYTERFVRLLWRICVVMPLGLLMLVLELFMGSIVAVVFLFAFDFTESALIRTRLYRNARWEVCAFFLSLRRIAQGEQP